MNYDYDPDLQVWCDWYLCPSILLPLRFSPHKIFFAASYFIVNLVYLVDDFCWDAAISRLIAITCSLHLQDTFRINHVRLEQKKLKEGGITKGRGVHQWKHGYCIWRYHKIFTAPLTPCWIQVVFVYHGIFIFILTPFLRISQCGSHTCVHSIITSSSES